MGPRSPVGCYPFCGLGMTRIGPAEVTRDPEGRVDVELDGRHLIFANRREWELFLFGEDSHRLAYNCLSWAVCPVPQQDALTGRPVLSGGGHLMFTDWG